MEVISFDTPELGDRSYLVSDGFTGLVIDPQRDIDRILETVDELGIEITHVLETHIHNDYVSGGLELASTTGAAYFVPALDDVDFERLSVGDGDELSAEAMTVRAIHTPGHTRNHFSYAVREGGGWEALFSGGSMLFGTTGRTDLLGPELAEDLTRAQYHSVRRLAEELPPQTHVHPTHGFGSFCSAGSAAQGNSTVATEISRNLALTLSEDAFVKELVDSLDSFPTYYAYMAPVNRAGPEPLDLSPPAEVDVAELISRIKAGEWVVDLRPRKAFAGAHLRGSLNFELGSRFTSYLGWALPWGEPVTLLGNSEEDVAAAQRSMARIGINRPAGAFIGDLRAQETEAKTGSYPVSDFEGLVQTIARGKDIVVLDARRPGEWSFGHIRGAYHIPFHELERRIPELPDAQIWVYCATGYRASVAASMLDRAGRSAVLVDGNWETAANLLLDWVVRDA